MAFLCLIGVDLAREVMREKYRDNLKEARMALEDFSTMHVLGGHPGR